MFPEWGTCCNAQCHAVENNWCECDLSHSEIMVEDHALNAMQGYCPLVALVANPHHTYFAVSTAVWTTK